MHYTCVIYPAKSLIELADELVRNGEDGSKYSDSARRAVENLRAIKTNIGTEGEHTFEDGMITCEALQLALMGIKIPSERDLYVAPPKKCLTSIVASNSDIRPIADREAQRSATGKRITTCSLRGT